MVMLLNIDRPPMTVTLHSRIVDTSNVPLLSASTLKKEIFIFSAAQNALVSEILVEMNFGMIRAVV